MSCSTARPFPEETHMATEISQTAPAIPKPAVDAGIPYELFLDCVHCGLCTAACPTYLELGTEMDSPRGRIYLMRAVTDGRLDLTHEVRRHLELCLDCRSCETACPSGVQYGRLIEPFRVAMEQVPSAAAAAGSRTDSKTHDWFHRLVLFGLFPYPRRVRLATAPARLAQVLGLDRLLDRVGAFRLLPPRLRQLQAMLPPFRFFSPRLPEMLPAHGKRRARVALFTGCIGDVVFRETNWATARVLQANGCDVLVPRAQVCCGAIHYHAGHELPALGLMAQNCRALDAAAVDAIIVNVAGCGSMLKDYGHVAQEVARRASSVHGSGREGHQNADGHGMPAPRSERDTQDLRRSTPDSGLATLFASKVRDITEFLVELGPVRPTGELRIRATYHDACHLVHAQRIRTQPRQLLEMIPGLELVPLEESELCCGAAGTYNLTEPEMAERLAARKELHIAATAAQAVFTANAGCLMQIGRRIRAARRPIWVAHPVEALDLSYRGKPVPVVR